VFFIKNGGLRVCEALPLFFLRGKFQAAWTPPATMNLGQKNFALEFIL
jgi:hypothetical protein